MVNIIGKAVEGIDQKQKAITSQPHIVTADIRKLSSELFRSLEDKSRGHVFSLCEELLVFRYAMEKLDKEKKEALMNWS